MTEDDSGLIRFLKTVGWWSGYVVVAVVAYLATYELQGPDPCDHYERMHNAFMAVAPCVALIAGIRWALRVRPMQALIRALLIGVGWQMLAFLLVGQVGAVGRGKQKRTMADMRFIAVQLEESKVVGGEYPSVESVEELAGLLGKDLPEVDGWGSRIRVESDVEGYQVASPGRCGVFEQEPQSYRTTLRTTNFNCDLVFRNGTFVVYPEGVQE